MQLMRGGVVVAGVRVHLARHGVQVPGTRAAIVEEDTALVTSAPLPSGPLPDEHPVRLYTELAHFKDLAPGTVKIRRTSPLTLMAIVYDYEQVPISRPAWVRAALRAALCEAARRGGGVVTLELLGARAPAFRAEVFLGLLKDTLETGCGASIEAIWLLRDAARTAPFDLAALAA